MDLRTLSNGITVITEKLPYFKTVSLGVYVRTGSAFETSENKGISHLTEHMLFKGTSKRSAIDIADEIVKLGDDVNAFTSKEFTVFYGTTLSELLERLISLLSDMVSNSVIDTQMLEKEKQIVAEEIALYADSPDDLVGEKLQEAIWPNALGYIISGDVQSVMKTSAEEIRAYIKERYTGSNIVISIAGAVEDSIFETLEKYFGLIPRGNSNIGLLSAPEYKRSVVKIRKKIDRVHMTMAFPSIPSNSDEQYAMEVFQSAFGGNNNSLLFQKIREELGLAYTVYSYSGCYRKAGLLMIDATVAAGSLLKTVAEINLLIENVRKNGLSYETLENCKKQVLIELVMDNESVFDRMSFNARQFLSDDKLVSTDEMAERVKIITREDVQAFVEKYLNLEAASYSFVGNFSPFTLKRFR